MLGLEIAIFNESHEKNRREFFFVHITKPIVTT